MSQEQFDILKRALDREKAARKAAEKILESKSAELYNLTQQLKDSNSKLEKLVKEKTLELKGVFENIVDAYVVMDLWGNVIKMNDAAIDLLGYNNSNEDFNLLTLADSSEADNVMNGFQSLLNEGHITNFEVKINTKYNQQKLVHINASIILDDKNNPIAAQGIVRDITKEKEAENKLIESENRLSSLILNLDAGILLEDEHRKILITNKQFCNIFKINANPETLIGIDCSDSANQVKYLFEDPNLFVKKVKSIIENKSPILGEEIIFKNGKIFERDYIPLYINDEYKGHLWSYKDVTLNRKYRKSIEAQKQKYSSIIANMNLGLIEFDINNKILFVNQSFLIMSGYNEDELIGKNAIDIFPTEEGKLTLKKENQKRENGIPSSFELQVKNKSGEIRYWLVSVAPNFDINGEIIGGIGIHLDITHLKQLEFQKGKLLAKLEKSNDELQEYAHIVSHDLKSPLRSIYALVNWLKEDNKDKLDETSLNNFAHIESSLEKMEQLISDVLAYSSSGVDFTENIEIDTNLLINDLIKLLFVPKHIKINIKSKLPIVKGDKTKLQQLFQNLISNAIKFIDKENGLIEIDFKDNNSFYQFSIKDNGIGIDKKYHNKIFKIFHALNKSKDSTGVGLAIVKKIVNLHKGEIWLESELNKGTTFYFTLRK